MRLSRVALASVLAVLPLGLVSCAGGDDPVRSENGGGVDSGSGTDDSSGDDDQSDSDDAEDEG